MIPASFSPPFYLPDSSRKARRPPFPVRGFPFFRSSSWQDSKDLSLTTSLLAEGRPTARNAGVSLQPYDALSKPGTRPILTLPGARSFFDLHPKASGRFDIPLPSGAASPDFSDLNRSPSALEASIERWRLTPDSPVSFPASRFTISVYSPNRAGLIDKICF